MVERVQLAGGKLEIVSSPGKGTPVHASFPRPDRHGAMTTLVIADDHEVVRRGVRSLLEPGGACRVVAEAADGLAAARPPRSSSRTSFFWT